LLCLVLSPSTVIANESDIAALNLLAKEYERVGKYDEAIQLYHHIIAIDPTKKNLSQKILMLNQKKTSSKATPSASPLLNKVFSSSSEVIVKSEQRTNIRSKLTQYQKDNQTIAKGYKAIEENRLSVALAYFNTILERRPKNTLSLYGKALVYEKRQEFKKVRDILSKEVKRTDDPKIHDLYNKAVSLLISSSESTLPLSDTKRHTATYRARFKEGEILLTKNNLVEAETLFQQLYLKDPSDTDVLLRLGETYSRLGEFSKAKEYYSSVLSYSSNNLYAQEGLAQTQYALKEYKESLSAYEKIDRKKWNNALEYNYKMAKVAYYIDSKQYDKGQILAEELYRKYPTRLDTIRQLANLTSALNPDDALHYRTLAYQQSRSMNDLIPLLYTLLDANRFTQSETYFNSLKGKSLSVQEKNELKKLYLLYYRKFSSMQLTQGHFEATERTVRSGLLIAANDAPLSENLGWSLLNQNKPGEALKIFEQMLTTAPSDQLYYASALAAHNAKEPKKGYAYLFKASKSTNLSVLKKIAELYEIMGYHQESLDTIKMIEEARLLGYPQPSDTKERQGTSPSESISQPQQQNDLNGVYNPFITSSQTSILPSKLPYLTSNTVINNPLSLYDTQKKTTFYSPVLSSNSSERSIDPILKLKQRILAKKQSSLSGSFFFETRSGTSGLDRLEKTIIPIEATLFPAFKKTFYAGSNIVQLHTGILKYEDRQRFGFGSNTGGTHHIESLYGIQPFIGYRDETEVFSFEARLSSTPLNSTIQKTTLNGYVSGKWNLSPWNVGLKALQESVDETLLSFVGQKDPENNEMWGQVVRKGIEGEVTHSSNLITSLRLGYYPSIHGVNTTTNSEMKGAFFIGKKMIENETTDFVLGPLFVYDQYDFSTNHFTYGHGGYFSPTSFFLASLYGDFSHTFDHEAFLRVKGNVGFSTFRESSEPFFPFDTSISNAYTANSNSGFSLNLKGYAGYKLDDNAHLLGMLGYSLAPEYGSVFVGISLIYYFDTLAALNPETLKRITYGWDKIQ